MQLLRYGYYTPGTMGARKQPCNAMTTHHSTQVSLFHQIAAFFAGPQTVKPEKKPQSVQINAVEVSVPLLPPTQLLDDSEDDKEPADLALADLIPAGLAAFNLPHYETAQPLDEQIGPSCLINACRLEDRPLTEAEQETAELTDLIPMELSKLNIARAKAALVMQENREAPTPLPDLATLQRINDTVSKTIQTAA